MNRKMLWLRISYRVGVIMDALFALKLSIDALNFTSEVRSVIGSAAALMWSWSVLLIWADRKPLERKGVLFLTAVPAIALLTVNNAISVLLGETSRIAYLVLGAGLIILFLFSYLRAKGVQANG